MAFDERNRPAGAQRPLARRKIAVVGAGVSGLSAAWLLSRAHDVVLYEKGARLGGHANTVLVPTDKGETPVDAGFIVFNEPNYPNLTAFLAHLGVATEESCMSFGASMRDGEVEYSGQTLSSVFARRSSALSPSFFAMLVDVVRFHRLARRALETGLPDTVSLADFIAHKRFSKAFARDFLEPMASAIWSTPSHDILDYPAASFFRFFANHGLLQVLDLPIWHTVAGGSRAYVSKLANALGGAARVNAAVVAVRREADCVEVIDAGGHRDRFHDVVIAAHADAALAMLEAPTAEERRLLGAFRYSVNRAVMHSDPAQMPRRRRAWSSWNYMGGADGSASVTYWMNRLQNLTCAREVFVTLNPGGPIAPEAVIAEFDYDHPMFNIAAGKAQKELWSLQGQGGVWFCGAHFGQGFHEDGLQSGLAVAEAIGGVRRPWATGDWAVERESSRIWLGDAARRQEASA